MSNKQHAFLREMTIDDLLPVLTWRNTPAVRKSMFSTAEITLEQHSQWFEKARKDPKISLMILELSGEAAGFVNIKQISEGKIADWSFHVSLESKKGTGFLLCSLAIEFAFTELKMKKLNGQVLSFNEKSIALHKKLGFEQEGLLRKNYYRNDHYYDVYLFGMTTSNWDKADATK